MNQLATRDGSPLKFSTGKLKVVDSPMGEEIDGNFCHG